ncbi:esterase/lipase family protein [Streptomyces sp. NPDC059063]|uniref:esterase/lipase family protein n=1 Tax=unclassified Streptomyces TaxID=2593676 RepID=UPI0036B40857
MSVWKPGRTRPATVAGALGCAFALVFSVPDAAGAAEPPPREDTRDRPVIFIHGIQLQPNGMRCDSVWGKTKKAFLKAGWKKKNLITFGYYKDSPGGACDVQYKGNVDSDLRDIGRFLRNYIWKHYGSKGKSVDIVAHSMGGLIAREAIIQARQADKDVFVEDAVTMGTPFRGSGLAEACSLYSRQCRQMRKDSTYLLTRTMFTLAGLHNARGGTDWTVMGSETDAVVSPRSAMGPSRLAEHHIRYVKPSKVYHSNNPSYYSKGKSRNRAKISHNYGEDYTARPALREPNFRAALAAYSESAF